MKHSKIVVVIVILSFISNQLFAGDIDLTGTVTNSSGIGINGATVELVTAGVSTTTDASGRYSFDVVAIAGQGISHISAVKPHFNSGSLNFEVSEVSKVAVDIYSLSGRKVLSPLNSKLASGNYTLSNLTGDLSPGAYIVATTIGNSQTASKMIVAQSKSGSVASLVRSSSNNSSRSSVSARRSRSTEVDTLLVTADGFKVAKIEVEATDGNYSGTQDFVLEVINSSNYELTIETGRHLIVTGHTVTGGDRYDFEYLASVPAATVITDGTPAVLAVDSKLTLTNEPWFADYLSRYRTESAYTINGSVHTVAGADNVTGLTGSTSAALSITVAKTFWNRSRYAVVTAGESYENALQGSALASLLGAPLLYATESNTTELSALLTELAVEKVVTVGSGLPDFSVATDNVVGSKQIATWVDNEGIDVNYIAVANSDDISFNGAVAAPKMSLTAPLLAARRKGLVFTVNSVSSSAEKVISSLKEYYTHRGSHPDYLALVGSNHSIPLSTVACPMWPETPLGTDLYYSIADNDSFPDIAIGRIIAHNGKEGSLLASRISTYDHLTDGTWDRQYVETGEWNFSSASPLVENYGYSALPSLVGTVAGDTKQIDAGIILHLAHSNQQYLGGAFTTHSISILSPSVVISKGCAVAGIDLSGSSYVPQNLFKLGAVAFIGAPRNATAASTQVHVETVNGMLRGLPLGKAYQNAISSLTVNYLDDSNDLGAKRERMNLMFMGDPALVITPPSSPVVAPATGTLSGERFTVTVPQTHFSTALNQTMMDEWSWTGSTLYTATIAGVTPKTGWAGKYDGQKHLYTTRLNSDRVVSSVRQEISLSTPLGMMGSFHIDEHQDGTSTALWNVRVMDFNNETNSVVGKANEIVFTVSY